MLDLSIYSLGLKMNKEKLIQREILHMKLHKFLVLLPQRLNNM